VVLAGFFDLFWITYSQNADSRARSNTRCERPPTGDGVSYKDCLLCRIGHGAILADPVPRISLPHVLIAQGIAIVLGFSRMVG
jgi:hypothetical protein